MKDLVITRVGEQLMTEALGGGDKITFTKVRVTDQDYSQTDLKSLDRILNARAFANVSGVMISTENPNINVYANVNNINVTTDFYVKAVGLYAKSSMREVLFAVSLGDGEGQFDYIPAFNKTNYVGLSYNFYIKLTDAHADVINITVDPSGVPTIGQMIDLENKVNGFDSWKTVTDEKIVNIESEKITTDEKIARLNAEKDMLMMDGYICPTIDGMYNHIEDGVYKKYIERVCVKDVKVISWADTAKISVPEIKYYLGTETPSIISNNNSVKVVRYADAHSVQGWTTTLGREIWFDNTLLSDDNLCFYYVLESAEFITIDGNESSHSKYMMSEAFAYDKSYKVGEYCIYNNVLYRCTKAGYEHIPSRQSTYWTAVNVGDEINSIKSIVDLTHLIAKNSAAHNGIFRGINLRDKYTMTEVYSMINDGSFDDLFVGDYFDISINGETMRCILAGFDLFLNTGDTNTTRHHAVVVTERAFTQRYQMGTSGTAGGFVNSNMWTTIIPEYVTELEDIIGANHLVSYKTELTNSVSSSSANGYEWAEVKMNLLSEIQLMGQAVFATNIYECGFENSQFPLFALNPSARITGRGTTARTSYFLKTIATSSNYVAMREDGHLGSLSASSTNGFRPFFLIG